MQLEPEDPGHVLLHVLRRAVRGVGHEHQVRKGGAKVGPVDGALVLGPAQEEGDPASSEQLRAQSGPEMCGAACCGVLRRGAGSSRPQPSTSNLPPGFNSSKTLACLPPRSFVSSQTPISPRASGPEGDVLGSVDVLALGAEDLDGTLPWDVRGADREAGLPLAVAAGAPAKLAVLELFQHGSQTPGRHNVPGRGEGRGPCA